VTLRWAVTVLVGAVVLAPAVWPDARDDFPLSTYPMFTEEQGQVVDLDTAVRIDAAGTHRLSPELIGGTDEPILASETVRLALRDGQAAADRLCREIAERARGDGGRIVLVTETHDAVALLRDDADPIEVATRADCVVPS
jgi:hypothetical protein